MIISKYSFGTGDRFAQQGEAQLAAMMKARQELGIEITPVWNKSNREHLLVHSEPIDTRREADQAVKALGYKGPYFVDADHVNMSNVDRFMDCSDYFTLDVVDYIGKDASAESIDKFLKANEKYLGSLRIPGLEKPFEISETLLREKAANYLYAVQEAGRIYRHIAEVKGADNFVTEVSMDEVDAPQTPIDMFIILHAIALEGIPAQAIAPKFTGRFHKGVDFKDDVAQFAKEFEEDLLVMDFAVKEFSLPENLKFSIHSGSDKFSIYPVIGDLLRKYDKGIHIKTAGTSWLEELIGLAMSDDAEALRLAKDVYKNTFCRFEELCAPYASVIDIDTKALPSVEEVDAWDGTTFADTLRHIPGHPQYNPHFRQLIHVGYKVAAEQGNAYIDALKRNKAVCADQIVANLYERHILRLFKK